MTPLLVLLVCESGDGWTFLIRLGWKVSSSEGGTCRGAPMGNSFRVRDSCLVDEAWSLRWLGGDRFQGLMMGWRKCSDASG